MAPAGEPRRTLTADAFAMLLARLGTDEASAGRSYETLRRGLVAFFTWRGAATPQECADETLDRLAGRLEDGAAIADLPAFARGIARLVLLEHWRRPAADPVPLEQVERGLSQPAVDPTDDALHACLDRCLAALPADGRELILRYYSAEGRGRIDARKQIAMSLGLSESALRNRAQRLRDRLAECLQECVGQQRGGTHAT
jgi:DNA-directed RNA polymerase specialized sigma24 family protein